MQKVLCGLQECSSLYIDDIIILVTWEEHLVHIDNGLSRLSVHGLTVKRNKCCWEYSLFKFLGLTAGNGLISIPQERIKKLRITFDLRQ